MLYASEDSFHIGIEDGMKVRFLSLQLAPACDYNFGPALANASEVARPIPDVAPVTSATFPSNSAIRPHFSTAGLGLHIAAICNILVN
jgi:hypothetical protein